MGIAADERFQMFENSVRRLSQLLGVKLGAGPTHRARPLRDSVYLAYELNETGQKRLRDQAALKVVILHRQLESMAKRNRPLFRHFRQRLRDEGTDQYFGTRSEISTAWWLMEKKIEFRKSEAPDFVAISNGHEIGIECGSVHFTSSSRRRVGRKISSEILEKGRRPYALPNCALLIDATNVVHHARDLPPSTRWEAVIRGRCQQSIVRTNFGSVLAAVTVYDHMAELLRYGFLRTDNAQMGPALKSFLDQNAALGRIEVLYAGTYEIP